MGVQWAKSRPLEDLWGAARTHQRQRLTELAAIPSGTGLIPAHMLSFNARWTWAAALASVEAHGSWLGTCAGDRDCELSPPPCASTQTLHQNFWLASPSESASRRADGS